MNSIVYRLGTVADIEQVIEITNRMLAHTGLGLATPDKIRKLITSPRTLALTACDADKIIGFTVGIVHESLFNDRVRVSDIGVFVLPEYRASRIARDLIAHLEKWAKEQGASEIWLGQTTGDNPDLVVKYYNRLGYKTKGFNCVKEI